MKNSTEITNEKKKWRIRTNSLKAHRVVKSVKRIEFGSIVVYFFFLLWCYCSSWTCVWAFDLLKKIIRRIDPVINHVPFGESQNGYFKLLLLLLLKLPEWFNSIVAQTFFYSISVVFNYYFSHLNHCQSMSTIANLKLK